MIILSVLHMFCSAKVSQLNHKCTFSIFFLFYILANLYICVVACLKTSFWEIIMGICHHFLTFLRQKTIN